MTEEKEYLYRMVKLMIVLNVGLYSIDEIKGAFSNKPKIINKLAAAEKEIENRVAKFIEEMFNSGDEVIREQLKQFEEIAEMVAKADFNDLQEIHKGLTKYYNDKNDNNS